MKKILLILSLFSLFSCTSENIEYSYPSDPDNARSNRAGKYFGKDLIIYGEKSNNSEQNSN